MSFSNSSGGPGSSGGPIRPKTTSASGVTPNSSAPSGPKAAAGPGLPRPLVTPLAPGAPRPAPSSRPSGGFGGPRPGGFAGPRPGGFAGPRPSTGRGRFEQPRPDEPRMNERIRVPQVRLIDDEGNQVGVVPTAQALQMARDKNLDLMEVSPNAAPPVCKIVDYGKFKYEKKKKDHVAKKKQTVIKVKEIQLRPQTEEHDLDYKFKNVRQFLVDGDKAKITIMFRGREIAYVDQGYKIMRDLAEMVKDVGGVEAPAKLEGKKLIMVLSPSSIGSAKKAPTSAGVKPVKAAGQRPAEAVAGAAPSAVAVAPPEGSAENTSSDEPDQGSEQAADEQTELAKE